MYEERKTMWFGMLALLACELAWLTIFVITVVTVYVEFYVPGGVDAITDDSPVAISVGLLFVLSIPLNLTGFVLAVVGLFRKRESKTFCVVGLIMSVALVLLTIVVVVAGFVESYSTHPPQV